MSVRLLAVTFDAHDPDVLARFWAAQLGRAVLADRGEPGDLSDPGEVVGAAPALVLPGSPTQVGLRFELDAGRSTSGPGRVHLHLTSSSPAEQRELVATAVERGARHLDVGQRPEEGHIVLADPEGNAFCVIEPGNGFLAGCGLLGELACDGTRDVGVFWSAALDWPLVWDEGGETAVQSPAGGTKVAWGGPPVRPRHGRNRQRLDVATDGPVESAVQQLVAQGATRLRDLGGRVELADPDGNEFVLRGAGRRTA